MKMTNVEGTVEEYFIGIDEAGLGPVFGPLVVGGVIIKKKNLTKLKEIGIDDSKIYGSTKNGREMRKFLWDKSNSSIHNYIYKIISAEDLDRENMYDLEIHAIAEILVKINWKMAKNIYIDLLGQTSLDQIFKKLRRWENSLDSKLFSQKIIYEKDADSKYVPVSMASIIAKTVRDEQVNLLCKKVNEKYVSGYPEPKTEAFLRKCLEKNGALPYGVRRTRNWPPLRELIEKENRMK